MSGTQPQAKGFDWKLKDKAYVRVYEGLDPRYGQVYTKSAQALAGMTGLEPGELVVDLACGTGLSTDVFARAVGPKGRVAQELHLAGRVDAVLSSFSYFYMYDFHKQLQEEVFRVLKPGGRLGFNIGTFLSPVEYQGRTYNTFTKIFDRTLDRLLREQGYSAGLDPAPPRPVPMYTRWDLSILERSGYRKIQAQPWPLPMSASQVYEYSIEGFHAQGMGFPSQTLMGLDQETRVGYLEETLDRCKEEMDAQGLQSHILNVTAVK